MRPVPGDARRPGGRGQLCNRHRRRREPAQFAQEVEPVRRQLHRVEFDDVQGLRTQSRQRRESTVRAAGPDVISRKVIARERAEVAVIVDQAQSLRHRAARRRGFSGARRHRPGSRRRPALSGVRDRGPLPAGAQETGLQPARRPRGTARHPAGRDLRRGVGLARRGGAGAVPRRDDGCNAVEGQRGADARAARATRCRGCSSPAPTRTPGRHPSASASTAFSRSLPWRPVRSGVQPMLRRGSTLSRRTSSVCRCVPVLMNTDFSCERTVEISRPASRA